MATAIAEKTPENASSIDDAMEVLFSKLDEAIDGMDWKYIIQRWIQISS